MLKNSPYPTLPLFTYYGVTPENLDYRNEIRDVIQIGGSSAHVDSLTSNITLKIQ